MMLRNRSLGLALAGLVCGWLVLAGSAGDAEARKPKPAAPALETWNGVAARGDIVFFARSDGVAVMDFTDPIRPVEIGRLELRFGIENVRLEGDTLYLASGSRGVLTVDVSDPTTPTVLEPFDTPGTVRDLRVRGDVVYLAEHGTGVRILDYSYRGEPRQIGTESTRGEMRAIELCGDLLVTAEGLAGARVFDVSGVRPRFVDELEDTGTALDVACDGERIVVAAARRGVLVYRRGRGGFDLAGKVATKRSAHRVALHGEDALVSFGDPTLTLIDVSDPAAPRVRADVTLSRDFPVWRVGLDGDRIYIASLESGFGLVDMKDPDAPVALLPIDRPLRITFP